MSSPPAKRQRTENAPITRSEFWHSDGSVVLQAEDTQFRVHWGVLSRNSSFFRGMQGLPQPADQPSIDGCPLVELPDAKADVEYLLKALYIPTFLSEEALAFPAVAALVRLGRKYDFKDLLDSAVKRLTFENPSTLEDYDARMDSGAYGSTRIVWRLVLLYDTISLARENNILSVLPCAYVRLAIYRSLAQLFDDPKSTGGSLALAPADQQQCIIGREKLWQIQVHKGYTMEWLQWSFPSNNCTNLARCTSTRDANLKFYLSQMRIMALDTAAAFAARTENCCSICKEHIQESMAAGRKRIWEELPSFFDLPPWGELKNDL